MYAETEAKRYKDSMVSAAFIGWQLGAGEKGQSFSDYLKLRGLVEEKDEMTAEEKEYEKIKAEHADQVCRKWYMKNVKGKK